MKQKDIVLIIVVAFVAGIFSVILSNFLFTNEKLNLTVETVDPISSTFKEADKTVFNENALNPTQLIQIGDNTKTAPF